MRRRCRSSSYSNHQPSTRTSRSKVSQSSGSHPRTLNSLHPLCAFSIRPSISISSGANAHETWLHCSELTEPGPGARSIQCPASRDGIGSLRTPLRARKHHVTWRVTGCSEGGTPSLDPGASPPRSGATTCGQCGPDGCALRRAVQFRVVQFTSAPRVAFGRLSARFVGAGVDDRTQRAQYAPRRPVADL